MKFQREQLLLYAITDRKCAPSVPLLEQVRQALEGGATIIQLREKELRGEELLREAVEIGALCRAFGVPFILNDDVDLALRCGADGVHVGIEDRPVGEIRKAVSRDFIGGATAKTVQQALAAEHAGADYLGVGAIFPSPTKPNAVRVTKEELKQIGDAVKIPTVAIGGLTLANIGTLKGCGMSGFALVSAIFGVKDIVAETKKLKEEAERLIKREN